MNIKRGFITIATGDEYYYKLAANLLLSYRFKTDYRYPFAIIAEEENRYTALFDDVVLTTEASRSFLDKFLLMKLCPYDETIFFDADILAYNDLNIFWDIFKDATDFSAIGGNYGLLEKGAWYSIQGIGKYGKDIQYKVKVHMGICFVRNAPSLKKLYKDSMDILSDYDTLTIDLCPDSKDEAILGISMPMNNMKAIPEKPEYFAVYPCLSYLKASIVRDTLIYKNIWGTSVNKGGMLIHFGSVNTRKPLYIFETECIQYLINHSKKSFIFNIRYVIGTRKISLFIQYGAIHLLKKLRRTWNKYGLH